MDFLRRLAARLGIGGGPERGGADERALREALGEQLERLEEILAEAGFDLDLRPPADRAAISAYGHRAGVRLDPQLAALWSLADGSDGELVLAVFTDQETPCEFLSVAESLRLWTEYTPHIAREYAQLRETYAGYVQQPPRDRRIKDYWFHDKWIPFADFGGDTRVMVDHDPGPGGRVGQVIAYQHDPDAVYCVAPDLVSFLRASNERMARHAREWLADEDLEEDGAR